MKKIPILSFVILISLHLDATAQQSMTAQWNGISGIGNTTFGWESGQSIGTSAYYNTYIGIYSGKSGSTGDYNTFLGSSSGYQNTSGKNNVYLGYRAGYNGNGSNNIFMGYQAGYSEPGSNLLYIDNSSTSSPLIWGDFSANKLNFNASVGIGTTSPTYKLDTKGDIYADGGWMRVSGQKGLYFQSYGGGLYMVDNTWIRTYGNKSFYHNTGTMRTDGTFQVGPSGDRFLVGTNGNVGVGTTAPGYKLDVAGDIRANNGWIRSTGDYGLYNNSDGTYLYSQDVNYWRTRSDRGFIIANQQNVVKGYLYHDNSNSFGLLDADGNWSVRFERDSNTRWYINNSQRMTLDNSGLSIAGNLKRTQHHTGHLEGSYNSVGSNDTRSNPIYTIGSSYNPSSTSLGNMYGIGYTHGNASFINSTDLGMTPASSWGMYVAADGNARIFLDASQGNGYFKGNLHPYGHVYGRSVDNSYSNLYRFGGLYLTWDSDSYGTNTHHSIRSTYGDTYGDNMTINTFNNLRINLDANNNGTAVFEIGHNTTHVENTIFKVQEDGKVDIGTSSQAVQIWHTAQEGNIGTSSGELRIRKGEADYLSFKESTAGSEINSHNSNLILKTDGGTGIEIDQEGDVLIKNDLKMTGQFKLDTAFVIEDAQAHQILNMQADGTIGFRHAETLTPWVVREVLDADGLPEHVITCDTTLGTSCSCGPQIVAELGLYDMNGNIKIGEGAYIDNDTVPGNNGAADDWIRINNSVEVSSSDPVRGFVLRDMDAQQDHFLNFHQKNGVSYFSNSNTSSNPEDNHFMKAGLDNSVAFPGTVIMPNFSADTLSSSGDLLMVMDSDESADDGTLRIGTGDPNDGVSWKENFNLTGSGVATFSSDIGDTGNPNRVSIDGASGKVSMNGNLEVGGTSDIAGNQTVGGFSTITGDQIVEGASTISGDQSVGGAFTVTGETKLASNLAIGGTAETPQAQVDGTTGNANFAGALQSSTMTAKLAGDTEAKAITVFNTTDNAEVFRVYNNGIVEAKEVLVSLDVWHDEVFEEDYELMPVEELETYVNKNHHLPEVPAEKEVIEKGVNVGEMQATLLKKIEQLTLYVIDQNKQLKEQMQLIDQQSTKIRKLEQQLD